jgi:hypothetical protein
VRASASPTAARDRASSRSASAERKCSIASHTIAAYRDTIRLLLAFAATQTSKRRATSTSTISRPLIGAFLDHLEHERGNAIRTRNARLAAIPRCCDTPPCATPSTPARARPQ